MSKGSIVERFWSHVQQTDGCWLWTGSGHRKGYGQLWDSEARTNIKAHRFSWRLHNGEIPEGMDVLHQCDNPPCVNPAHLFLGTHADNNRDRARKGRSRRTLGEASHRAKLTERIVLEIRSRQTEGLHCLSRALGIPYRTIHDVVHRRTWKHIA